MSTSNDGIRSLRAASGRSRKASWELSRRAFLGSSAGLLASAGLWYPKKAFAAPLERKFMFFFAGGGWDTAAVLDPHFAPDGVGPVAGVDHDVGTFLGQRGGLQWVSGGTGNGMANDRADVDEFMANWSPYSAIINGIDAHSVGHDSGTQFMMTGTSASSYSDWPTLLASNSQLEYPLPHIVFSGPSFPGTNGAAVVRAGGGTLLQLMDGSISGMADAPSPIMAPPADDMVDEFVYTRVADFASRQRGLARERADGLVSNIERAMELEGRQFEAGLSDLGNTLLDQMLKASEMFRLGLSRCAMISIPGGYDSHGDNTVQGPQQAAFFAALNELFDHMASTPGHTADLLLNEVTVVALSEFGRTPKLNGGGGKDHWPYNSVFVAGAGVNGGNSYGRTDDSLIAMPIDLKTGKAFEADGVTPVANGAMLGAEHVGLGLLKIGGLDPTHFLPGVDTLDALVRGA